MTHEKNIFAGLEKKIPKDSKDSRFINIPISRELFEKEVSAEIDAFRDEKLLRSLSKEDREIIGENPVGELMAIPLEQLGPLGSFTQGVGCGGTPAFSNGVTCKWIQGRRGRPKTPGRKPGNVIGNL